MSSPAQDGTFHDTYESNESPEEVHTQSASSSAPSSSGADHEDRTLNSPPPLEGSPMSSHLSRGIGGDDKSGSLNRTKTKAAAPNFARAPVLSAVRPKPTMKLTRGDGNMYNNRMLIHEYVEREEGAEAEDDRKKPPTFPGMEGEVGQIEVQLLLRFARRILRDGLYVYQLRLGSEKSTHLSRLLSQSRPQSKVYRQVRQLYVGTQPEYLELTTASTFETSLHLASITRVTSETATLMELPEFRLYDPAQFPAQKQDPDVLRANYSPILNKKTCLLIEAGPDQRLCLIFHGERERRFAQFQIMVEQRVLTQRYAGIERKFAELCDQSQVSVTIARSVLDA